MNFLFKVLVFVWTFGAGSMSNSSEKSAKNYPKLSNRRPHPVVIGGYVAGMEDFPYAVRIYVSTGKVLTFCTGEAVHTKLVMTAAHCVNQGGHAIVVTACGEQEDYVNGKNLEKYARYKVIKVFVHPEFDKDQYVNDVALLKTGRPMLHPGHQIIQISYEQITEPFDAVIYGWGGTEFQAKNDQLFGKHLKAGNCSLSPSPSVLFKYLCLLEKGICHGDSGGGLILNDTIVGVASFYHKQSPGLCGTGDLYYYTAMSEVAEFVKDTIERNGSEDNRPLGIVLVKCLVMIMLLK